MPSLQLIAAVAGTLLASVKAGSAFFPSIDIFEEHMRLDKEMYGLPVTAAFDLRVRTFHCPITSEITSKRMRYNHTDTHRCSMMPIIGDMCLNKLE